MHLYAQLLNCTVARNQANLHIKHKSMLSLGLSKTACICNFRTNTLLTI